MAGRIATKAYCNSIAGTSVFTSNLNECPTYSEIIGTKKLTVSGLHDNNQLVLQSEISLGAKVKFGLYTTNRNIPCTIVISNFRVTSDVASMSVKNLNLSMTSYAWMVDPMGGMDNYGYYPLGEISGTKIVSSSGTLKFNGVIRSQDWEFIEGFVIDWAIRVDR